MVEDIYTFSYIRTVYLQIGTEGKTKFYFEFLVN